MRRKPNAFLLSRARKKANYRRANLEYWAGIGTLYYDALAYPIHPYLPRPEVIIQTSGYVDVGYYQREGYSIERPEKASR